jgi:hypothetical protein
MSASVGFPLPSRSVGSALWTVSNRLAEAGVIFLGYFGLIMSLVFLSCDFPADWQVRICLDIVGMSLLMIVGFQHRLERRCLTIRHTDATFRG